MRDVSESEALFSEAKSALGDGNYQRGIEIYGAILTQWQGHMEICERASAGLGEVYITLRNLRLAEKYVKQALGYDPLAPHYHYLLGFIYSVDRRWDRARVEFEVGVKGDPENPEYLRGLGWVLCNSGRLRKGREYLLRALALAPDDVSILTDLALAHMDAREFDKALDYMQRAARTAPRNALVQLAYEVLAHVRDFADNTGGKEEAVKRAQ
jgi:tetratricopeptide (TPR) repeat protein